MELRLPASSSSTAARQWHSSERSGTDSRVAAGTGRRGGLLVHSSLALAAALGLGRPLIGGVADDEDAAARGAGGVGGEPGVDARDVEGVAALRQHADLLPGRELRQADGALRQDLRLRHGVLVGEARQRPERLLLEPPPGGGLGGGGRPGAGARAPRDGGETHDADERAEECREDDDHVGVDGQRARRLGRGERRVLRGVGLQEPPRWRRHCWTDQGGRGQAGVAAPQWWTGG